MKITAHQIWNKAKLLWYINHSIICLHARFGIYLYVTVC